VAQLVLEIPDTLVEQLESAIAPVAMTLEERYERFFKESGLFVQVPEEERRRYQPMSEEHRRELSAKLGAAGPLSEVIIEERKTR
jgi:hypothetical protein